MNYWLSLSGYLCESCGENYENRNYLSAFITLLKEHGLDIAELHFLHHVSWPSKLHHFDTRLASKEVINICATWKLAAKSNHKLVHICCFRFQPKFFKSHVWTVGLVFEGHGVTPSPRIKWIMWEWLSVSHELWVKLDYLQPEQI